jgi:hypothetical protein
MPTVSFDGHSLDACTLLHCGRCSSRSRKKGGDGESLHDEVLAVDDMQMVSVVSEEIGRTFVNSASR